MHINFKYQNFNNFINRIKIEDGRTQYVNDGHVLIMV